MVVFCEETSQFSSTLIEMLRTSNLEVRADNTQNAFENEKKLSAYKMKTLGNRSIYNVHRTLYIVQRSNEKPRDLCSTKAKIALLE